MTKLIYLSPSDQTDNKYAYGNTTEAVQCRKIADACAAALKAVGFSVINNKTNNMYDRVTESNKKKADLHICIHTNTFNSKVTGTRIFSWDKKGEGYKAAKAIYDVLAPITPGKSENVSTNQTWYEMKNTNAPCAYCECEFHDNTESAKWIVEHTAEIGEAIAKGICNCFGVSEKEPEKPAENKKSISELADEVIAGKWGNGSDRAKRLKAAGYDYDAVQAEVNKRYSTSVSPVLTKGSAVKLSNCPLYGTSTTSKIANRLTGTYYLWDGKLINNRYRITNAKNRVGVSGQITGWINKTDI